MSKRKLGIYKELFFKYDELCDEQDELYEGLTLPEDKKKVFTELQVKKLAILEEMDKCL